MSALDRLSRSELYDLVWSEALVTLAPKYGISDVALKKRCKVRGVPTPPRGYWAKLEAGKQVIKLSLPKTIPIRETVVSKPEDVVYFAPDRDYSLRSPHWATVATRDFLRRGHLGQYNLTRSYSSLGMLVEVSKPSIKRALWMMDGLIRHLEFLGATLSSEVPRERGLCAVCLGEHAHLAIKEKIRQFDNPNRRDHYSEAKINVPSGILKIQVRFSGWCGDRQWIETVNSPMEGRLESISAEIMGWLVVARVKVDRKLREDTFREHERECERQLLRIQKAEEERRERLVERANSMADSRYVIALIDAVHSAVASNQMDDEARERLQSWTSWANDHAARLDPVTQILNELGISM